MSMKTKVAAGTATLGLVAGGLGLAGTMTASAATPTCGSACTNIFSMKYGPRYLVDTFQAKATAGQPVILFQKSNSDPAEDFVVKALGTVGSFYYDHGLVTPAFDHAYTNNYAYEFQYEPYGLNSNYCVSTWSGETPQPGYKVRLEPCGEYSNSLWVTDTANTGTDDCSTGSVLSSNATDVPLINGADNTFSNPEVLTYPAGNPTDMPRPWLQVWPEKSFSDGISFDNQQWGTAVGPVASGAGPVCPPPSEPVY